MPQVDAFLPPFQYLSAYGVLEKQLVERIIINFNAIHTPPRCLDVL